MWIYLTDSLAELSQDSLFPPPLWCLPCSFRCSTLLVVTLRHGCHFLLQPPHLLSVLPANLPVRTQGFTGMEEERILLHVTMALQSYYFRDDNERRHNTIPVILTCELAWAEQSAPRCPSCVGCCPSQLCLLSHGLKPAASSELVPWDQMKHSGRQSIQVL